MRLLSPRSLLLLPLLLLPAIRSHASGRPLTLDEAVQRGVARAPLVRAGRDAIAASRAQADRAGRLPDPSMSVGVANYPVTAPDALRWGAEPMSMRTVGLTQAIPSEAMRAAQRRRADSSVDVAIASRAVTVESTEQRVADAWIAVWTEGQRQSELVALRDESALAVQIARARLRGGEGSATDVLAAQAAALTLENRIDAVNAAWRAARAELQRWVGSDAPSVGDAPNFARLPQTPAALEENVDRQVPMRVWRARESAAAAAVAEARAAKRPDWSIGVTYGNRGPGRSDMVSLQFSVSLPVFTRHRQDAGVSAADDEWRAIQASHDDARRAQRAAVAARLAAWRGWSRQVDRDRDALLPLARDRARTALAAYRGGGSLQPWLEARRDEIDLRLSYVDAVAARAEQWAALAYLMPGQEELP
ncbi:MAG: TolC family protein [Gammaproteobacteria bacterium]|nr:TolC family protein [Gammaproteobacteria bacterium]